MKQLNLAASIFTSAFLFVHIGTTAQAATNVWSGAGGDKLWSNATNWTGAIPDATNDTVFLGTDATGSAGPLGASNNVVDTSLSLRTLSYRNTNGFHNSHIVAGATLTAGAQLGAAANAVYVGNGGVAANATNYATIQGPGTLVVSNPSNATILVSQRSSLNDAHRAILDLSGLDTFMANISRLAIATDGNVSPNNYPCGTLLLAKTNDITCSDTGQGNSIIVGLTAQNPGQTSFLRLGQMNVFKADGGLKVGSSKSSAVMNFNDGLSSPTAVFRNKAGNGAMPYWGIGDNSAQNSNSGINNDGRADFSGGTIDALVGSLYVGRSLNSNTGTAVTVGTLIFAAGTISATNIEVGFQSALGQGGAVGTLAVGSGGQLLGSGNLRLASFVVASNNFGSATGRLNIGGGSASVSGSILDGGGTSAVNLTNATLTVGGQLGTAAFPIDSMSASDSTLNLFLTGGTSAVVTALATGGSTNRITVMQLPAIGSYPAQFTVIQYAGAIGGNGFNFGLGNASNFPGYLVDNAGNTSVDIVITGAISAAAITWVGGASSNWDAGLSANWKDGDGNATVFRQLDAVTLDDTASNFVVNLVGQLAPSALTVNNPASNYSISGSGRLTGSSGLTKQGQGALILANTGGNNFSGPIALEGGTLALVRDDSYTLANVLSGAGHLQKVGGGTTILSGSSTGFLGAVTIDGGTLQVGAGGTSGQVQGPVTNRGALVFSRSDAITYGGSISGTGSVTKLAGNTLTLNGASSYGGPTLVGGGVLLVQNNLGLGNSSRATVNNGTTLRLDGGVTITNVPLTLVNGGIDSQGPLQGSNGTNTWAGPITIGANQVRMGAISGSTLVVSGVIDSGTNNFGLAMRCQDTAATLVVAASNTWLGASSIVVGSVKLDGGDHRLPVSSSLTLGNVADVSGAILDLAGWNQRVAGLASLGNFMAVVLTNSAGTLATLTLGFDATTTSFRGPIGGMIALTKAGTGIQALSGASTYSGDTTVSGGTLRLGANNVLPDGAGKGNVAVEGSLDLAGYSEAINGLSGSGLIDNLSRTGTNTLTIGNNDGAGTFNGVIANTSGTVSLVKAGAGTITLGATNTYAGTTTIQGGTLALGANGSIKASTGFTIAGGAVLDASAPGSFHVGTGEVLTAGRTNAFASDIVGTLASEGSISLAGAAKAATLTIAGGLALTNATVAFDLGQAATPGSGVNDLIAINGPLSLGGTSTIIPTFYTAPGTGTYTLIAGGTSLVGSDANLALVWPSNALRQTASLDASTTPGDVLLLVGGASASLVWAGTNSSVWDVNASANWDHAGLPDFFFNYDAVRFDDTSTNDTVDVAVAVAPTTVVFSNDLRTYALGGAGKITGNPTVIKDGVGTVTIHLANDYTGPTIVTGGVLKVGSPAALGATNAGTRVTEGGTLDLNSTFINDDVITLSGSGAGGQGALVNNQPSFTANYGLRFLTLAGDAWVGGSGRYDVKNAPTVLGNGYTLNKVGTNTVNFVNAVDANFGTVNISNGMVQIQELTTLGASTNAINTVAPGMLGFYDAMVTNVQPLAFVGGRLWVRSGSASLAGVATLAGDVDVRVDATALNLYGAIGGPGGFAKNGTGALNLYGPSNTWAGGATLHAGAVNVRASETLVGRITNNTTLAFLPGTGEIFTCSADITGFGSVSHTTAGTTLLTGTNVCDGGTAVSAGLLEVAGLLGGPLAVNGSVLQVDGGGVVQAGTLVVGLNTHATNSALPGASFSVGSGSTNDLIVAVRTNNTGIGPQGRLDVSALSNFSANVGNLLVGVSTEASTVAPPVGRILLATNNNLVATNFVIGHILGSGGFNSLVNTVVLGSGLNTVQTPVLVVGGQKMSAEMTLGPGGTLVLNNGTNATDLAVGINTIMTGANPINLLDLSRGTFVASLNNIVIAQKAPGLDVNSGTGITTATLLMGDNVSNNVTAASLLVGQVVTSSAGAAYGTLVVSGGTFAVSGDVTLGSLIGSTVPVQGSLLLRGGLFALAGNVVDGSADANAISRLLLDGATLDLMPAGDTNGAGVIGTGALPVDNLQLRSGVLQHVAEINGGGAVVKDGPGTLVLAGTNTYTGPTVVSNGTLLVNGILGAGGITVDAAATLGGVGTIGGAVDNRGTLEPGTSIGLLTIGSTFTQSPGGVYRMEIGGAGAGGVDYDLLQVAGAAALDGTLRVALTNGFTPVVGHTFTVLTASAFSGAFAVSDVPPVPGATWQITTNAGALLLNVVSAASPYGDWVALHGLGLGSELGDADNDGYNNLLEYSQFSDPTNSASKAAMGGNRSTNNALQLLFSRNTNAVDITYVVEAAYSITNGADWQGINTNVHGLGWSDPGNATEFGVGNPRPVTVRDPVIGATNRYLRLRVTKP